jgi:hypothetical protein
VAMARRLSFSFSSSDWNFVSGVITAFLSFC